MRAWYLALGSVVLCYENKARLFWRHLVELNDTLKGNVIFSRLNRE